MKAKIMIIEDEESIVTLVKYNLEKEGYKVFSNSNGEKAIEHIKEIAPDLILLDWMLPNLSGIEICKILKNEKKHKHMPTISVTNHQQMSAWRNMKLTCSAFKHKKTS